MRFGITLILVIALFTLMYPAPLAQARDGRDAIVADAHDDNLVVPGERVGWMKIGMKFDNVTKRLGNDYKPAGTSPSCTDMYFPKYQLTFSLSGNKEIVRGGRGS